VHVSERVMTCILCPNGCELRVMWDGAPSSDSLSVEGNLCPKGIAYAVDELTHPMRTLTTSVRVRGGVQPLASVKTALPVSRDALGSVRAALRPIVLDAPVHAGDVVLMNAAGTGTSVVITRDVPRRAVRQHAACLRDAGDA
jgi:CxxC motif-containing protein